MKFLKPLLVGGAICVVLLEVYVLLREDSAPALESSHYYTQGNITIESVDHQERNKTKSKPFSRHEGDVFGLDKYNNFSVLESLQPASRGRGIAAGDFNNDGWQDVLLGTNSGILLYKNIGGRFVLQDVNLTGILNLDLGVHIATFIDIDNDGWQDIYLTIYGGKNYFLLNDKKGFKNSKVLEVPNSGAVLTTAVSFGDLNKNGWLDFVQGNWLSSLFLSKTGAEINKLIRNNNLKFTEEDLKEFHGQTLSVLLADFNNDNNLDLIDGNEFFAPDNFFLGDGKGGGTCDKKVRRNNSRFCQG